MDNITVGKIELVTFKKELEKILGKPAEYDYWIKIRRANNGFVLEYPQEEDYLNLPDVIECQDNEKETMANLFYDIAEYFGIMPNKYGNENLNISWDKEGHKYEPPQG